MPAAKTSLASPGRLLKKGFFSSLPVFKGTFRLRKITLKSKMSAVKLTRNSRPCIYLSEGNPALNVRREASKIRLESEIPDKENGRDAGNNKVDDNDSKPEEELMYKKVLLACVLGGTLLAGGCGTEGPMGPAGPTGATGISMIQEYTGSFSTAGDFAVSVPEITNKRSTTYVEVYWAIPGAPDIWTSMSDGWKDDPAQSRTATVSWTNGEVGFWGMSAGDLYLIQVFQHN